MFIEYSTDAIKDSRETTIKESLFYACIAMKAGHHVVCTETPQLAIDIRNLTMNKEESISRCFDKLNENFSQIASVKKYLNVYIRIVPGNSSPDSKEMADKEVIEIGIERTINSDFWHKTYFVVENLIDVDGYRIILDCCNPQKITTAWEHIHGGGATIADVLEEKSKQKSFFLSIIDSDKHFFDDKLGVTAQKVVSKGSSKMCFVAITGPHEIENLFFTPSIFEMYMNGAPNAVQLRIISTLEKAMRIKPDIAFYYDIKSGYRYKEIKNFPYLLAAFSESISPCDRRDDSNLCGLCKTCESIIIEAIGKNYFSTVIKDKRITANITNLYCDFPELFKEEWQRISKIMLSWCCGMRVEALGA